MESTEWGTQGSRPGGGGKHLSKGTHTHFMTLSTGPSIALDTACSSSLLALQNAYQAIRSGECSTALVGGINLLLKPNTSVQFMKLGMLSPDGACRSFDESGKVGLGRDRKALLCRAPACTLSGIWAPGGEGKEDMCMYRLIAHTPSHQST